jgi:hypothetical protein
MAPSARKLMSKNGEKEEKTPVFMQFISILDENFLKTIQKLDREIQKSNSRPL